MSLNLDSRHSRAVLIGTTDCHEDRESLPPLPSVKNNIDSISAILKNEDIIGLNTDNVAILLDESSPSKLLVKLNTLAQSATDTLLIYYSGHGLKSSTGSGLFIPTTETTQKYCHLNGVEFNRIREIIDECPARKKILIFDCCYSGEILFNEMGGADESVIANNIKIQGTYSIASAPRNRLAFSPAGERYTAFTKELIDILEKGLPENTEFLTLERIFREVKTRITTNPSLPEPQCNIPFGLPEFTLSRNINWSSNPEIRVSNIKALYEKELASKDAQLEDMEQRHIAKLAEMSSEITHFQNIEREIHVELSEKKQRITQLENLFMPMEQRYKNELTQMGK